jgi:hypothetical protein
VVEHPDTKKQGKLIASWRTDPEKFVHEVFGAKPDLWQQKVLQALVVEPRIAMSACKGPGKSCLLAWIIWWFLLCHPDAQIIALSITRDNLKDNLWKELAYWQGQADALHNKRLEFIAKKTGAAHVNQPSILTRYFEYSNARIVSREKPNTWWVSARGFSKSADPTQQANTLAGFHGENIMIVLDEVGDYPEGVVSAAEAIFATAGQNTKLVVAGNPTDPQGPLGRIVSRDAANWHIVYITGDPDDPERSPRIDINWARQQIATWGRDNPWVMVNVLGLFPPVGANQLIDINRVTQAMARKAVREHFINSERVWGLDPSRFGDDEACLMRRWGSVVLQPKVWRNLDGTQLGNMMAFEMKEAADAGEAPDAVFIDVGGVGASVYDRLRVLGWEVIAIDFGSKAQDSRFANKRAEIWWRMAEFLKSPTCVLPNDPVIRGELVGPKFDFKVINHRTCFVLESKKAMKARGVPSPNRADALALTWSQPVVPQRHESPYGVRATERQAKAVIDYDPLA